jgi:uncharacterized 2Fe-2S/4Fe-4S cluster protein (DUF4445 family)
VKVLAGTLAPTEDERGTLTPQELAEGWRLACRAVAEGDLTLDVAQWDVPVLVDDSVFEFTPGEGLGIAVDLGTTTLVAQLLDLATGRVLGVRTGSNPQAGYGADIMSRIQFGLRVEGAGKLRGLIRAGIGRLIEELLPAAHGAIRKVVIVGNTAMHHLFCGIDVEPLSHVPFETTRDGLERFRAAELGWQVPGDPVVEFLPCLGGFVGSDILAGLLATRMHESGGLVGLIDLGTNGEIAFGTRERILCASTAAGPAFEGGRITMGMQAATGAISEVRVVEGRLECRVLGGAAPRGLCGSGLVDAVAAGLELGLISPSGRLSNGGAAFAICPPVALAQSDIRELQLAKGAIAAGIRIVLDLLGRSEVEVERLYLAGAFGNYINRASARRIGLIDFPEEKIEPAGNTALLGAKLALFGTPFEGVRRRVEHLSLAADRRFQEIYVEEMAFPEPAR